MKIWIQSSAFLPTPPSTSGGLEYVVHKGAQALVALGHEVTLFGLRGSALTRGKVVEVERHKTPIQTETMMIDAMERLPRPDVLWDNSLHQFAQRRWPTLPAISMSHGEAPFAPYARNPVFVSGAHAFWHGRPHAEVVHNCVDLGDYRLGSPMANRRPEPLFLGRILPYKRPHLAADLCAAAGLRLTIAGPVSDQAYFDAEIRPRIERGSCRHIGEATGRDKVALLQAFACLLFTSEAREPAGIVMLEAMACGTPVIAYDHGANPEYIAHGQTGFLFKDDEQIVECLRLRQWEQIDPMACWNHVDENFSRDAYGQNIEAVLTRAKEGDSW